MHRRTVLASLAASVASAGAAGCVGRVPDSVGGRSRSDPPSGPESDVDGDGFTASEERHHLEGADVGRMDIFVEIDWTPGSRPDPDAMAELVDVYDDAPVAATPEAEEGVNLHLRYGEAVPPTVGAADLETLRTYRDEYFTNVGRGYHYALFVEEFVSSMYGTADPGALIVQGQYEDHSTGYAVKVFAHELGHSLGLVRDVFDGIDSADLPYEAYPSVMNYASQEVEGHLDFSDGSNSEDDFDDWSYLAEHLHVPDTGRLGAADAPVQR